MNLHACTKPIVDAGFDPAVMGSNTPITNARFEKLFINTFEEGKNFSGRLGNIDTRVATVREAALLELKSPRIPEPIRSRGWGTV
jgi:hypothetical protein